MPPKRAAAGGSSRAKRPRPSADGTNRPDEAEIANTIQEGMANATIQRRRKRWSAVSNSANIDAEYFMDLRDPFKAYEFECLCRVPFRDGGDDDDDGEDEEDEDEGDKENEENEAPGDAEQSKKRVPCDGGETCLCGKPAADFPDHAWKISVAGRRKFRDQHVHFNVRDPDSFGMYTFNDHLGYGVMEILQNLILDFEDAADNYKERWAVCEALGIFLATDGAGAVTQVDDGDAVDATYELIGRLFLCMLAQLERDVRLSKDSEIKNLGWIMALYMDFARGSRDYGLLESDKKDALGPPKDKKKWVPHSFDNQVLAYARKYDIPLVGLSKIDVIVAEANADVELPAPESNTGKADPFGFARTLRKYEDRHGGIAAFLTGNKSGATPIGGDSLDITSWTSAKRKSKAYDKKDPLPKAILDGLKKGQVVSPA